MIHVAPCSCELHARIRELEKELHMEQMRVHDFESALIMASTRIVNLEAELADMTAQAKTLALARDGFAKKVTQ